MQMINPNSPPKSPIFEVKSPEKSCSFNNARQEIHDTVSPAPESAITRPEPDIDTAAGGNGDTNNIKEAADRHADDQENPPSSPPAPEAPPELNLSELSDEIDDFLAAISEQSSSGSRPEVPSAINSFANAVESLIARYGSGEARFGLSPEEDSSLFDAVDRIRRLTDALGDFQEPAASAYFNRTSIVLHTAMTLFEEEFRVLLAEVLENENSKNSSQAPSPTPDSGVRSGGGGGGGGGLAAIRSSKLSSSFSSSSRDGPDGGSFPSDHCLLPEPSNSPPEDPEFPAYSQESVDRMGRLSAAMISAGYEAECSQAYALLRRLALWEAMAKLGLRRNSIDDVQRTQWDSLNGEITTWIDAAKQCASIIFPGERKLCESLFPTRAAAPLFSSLARAVVCHLLNFAEAVAMLRRSSDKLFRFLDMYETLRDVVAPAIDADACSEECMRELHSETFAAAGHLGDGAVGNFCDLENSIKGNTVKTPVPGGGLHPLTRYTMNYLTYACEYEDTLEQVFLERHKKMEGSGRSSPDPPNPGSDHTDPDHPDSNRINNNNNNNNNNTDDGGIYHHQHIANVAAANTDPFSLQLARVMDLLDMNLESHSKLYKDSSLRNIFLMNNGRYILQKIKGSEEMHAVIGDTWCRKRSSDLRQYHKNYQRDTWVRVLGCLKDEGLSVKGKVSKPALKERFKSFNATFDEILRTQSAWVVSDEQLQSELRVSISSLVIPAYRSFLGRFQQYLDPGRQTEKYIKLQPEDIEAAIEELFDGNTTSMVRKKV